VHVTVDELCTKAKASLAKASGQFSKLASKIPNNQYFRFNDHWRFVISTKFVLYMVFVTPFQYLLQVCYAALLFLGDIDFFPGVREISTAF
jgi:hypothetical protein